MLPFFALMVQERESPDKEYCHVVQPLHVDSKDENKNVNAYFFLFVLHVVCLFFYCKHNPFLFTKYTRHFHKHKSFTKRNSC